MYCNLNLETGLTKGLTAYFSHSLSTYGTKNEKRIFKFLSNELQMEVLCPNQHLGDLKYLSNYAEIASEVDILFIWSESNDIGLSKGCFDEAKAAIEKGKQLFLIEVHGDELHLRWISNLIKEFEGNLNDYGIVICSEAEKYKLK
ncbi:hypothetical protein LB452_13045 [Psychroflexus sp. CAK8W]|uniref:Uncharacterized protein n=1 Tax=Psychroflexus longus TaxID=2873596 RepID=A0ABS7XLN0_9FLAO|nr:hypothetical protein [Psychroflexus longus]MBZ9779848.1 hypothetical protein [Psychroflexus longus]